MLAPASTSLVLSQTWSIPLLHADDPQLDVRHVPVSAEGVFKRPSFARSDVRCRCRPECAFSDYSASAVSQDALEFYPLGDSPSVLHFSHNPDCARIALPAVEIQDCKAMTLYTRLVLSSHSPIRLARVVFDCRQPGRRFQIFGRFVLGGFSAATHGYKRCTEYDSGKSQIRPPRRDRLDTRISHYQHSTIYRMLTLSAS